MHLQEYDKMKFADCIEAGGDYEGLISLRAPLNGVARYDILVSMQNNTQLLIDFNSNWN